MLCLFSVTAAAAVPGEVDLSNLSIPRHEMDKIPAQAMDMLKENLRWVMSKNNLLPNNGSMNSLNLPSDVGKGGGEQGATGEPASNSVNTSTGNLSNNAVSSENSQVTGSQVSDQWLVRYRVTLVSLMQNEQWSN